MARLAGHPFAVRSLAELAVTQNQGRESILPLIPELQILAKRGDAFAQELLSRIYFDQDSSPQEKKMAVYWLKKAAKQGDLKARFALAKRYTVGNGISQDLLKASNLYVQIINEFRSDKAILGLAAYSMAVIDWERGFFRPALTWIQFAVLKCGYQEGATLYQQILDHEGLNRNSFRGSSSSSSSGFSNSSDNIPLAFLVAAFRPII